MAHTTTGTNNQDKLSDPQLNENPDDQVNDKKREIKNSGAESEPRSILNKNQENLQNRGIEEDQPENPIHSTGSLDNIQQQDKYRQPGDKFPEDADKISS